MSTNKKPMTLQELSDRLLALLAEGVPGKAEVATEGCDCYGDVGEVTYDASGYVFLARVP